MYCTIFYKVKAHTIFFYHASAKKKQKKLLILNYAGIVSPFFFLPKNVLELIIFG